MPFDKTAALADIDRVLTQTPQSAGHGAVYEFVAAARACIERNTPPGSTYREQAAYAATLPVHARPNQRLHGALNALRADVKADALATFEEQVHADVFSDLLAQAEHLNNQRFRRAAAVLAGGALEEHLRQLAGKHNVPTHDGNNVPRKASGLNADLYKANAYGKAEHAQVDAWQKVRNAAAHPDEPGEPSFEDNHDAAKIDRMTEGVRDFIVKYPA